MTTVNSQSLSVQNYDKNTDVTPKAKASVPVQADTAQSLNNGDKVETYKVKKGDTLWGISKVKLGDAQKWPEVAELNKDQIKNPNRIYPNQVIKIRVGVSQNPPVAVKPIPEKPVDITPTPKPVDPISTPPSNPPVAVKPTPTTPTPVKKNYSVLKGAGIGAAVGAGATAATLVGITASLSGPVANLGGYATAQIINKGLTQIGLSLGSAPQVAQLVKSVGGPKVAGTIVVVGVGVAVAGLAAGGVYLYNKNKNQNETK